MKERLDNATVRKIGGKKGRKENIARERTSKGESKGENIGRYVLLKTVEKNAVKRV